VESVAPLSRFWWLMRTAAVLVYEENGLSVSKGAAYSALLSLFPVLTTLAAILVQAQAGPLLDVLSDLLYQAAPPGTEDLLLNRFTGHGEKPVSLLVFATLLSLHAASGVMLSLMEGFNGVYHVPTERSFLRNRAVAVLLVFSTALPAVGASALIVFGSRTEQSFLLRLGAIQSAQITGGILFIGQIVRYAVALVTVVLVTVVMYYIGTNRPQRWAQVWSGAVVATVLWLAATQGFAWYVRNMAGYNFFYGSVGAVIALIVWMYLLAVIALFGCAFNAARERLLNAELESAD
jgi:membrane protein